MSRSLLDVRDVKRPTIHDLYAAEVVLDLWDLAHMAMVSRDPITVETWGRIRGVEDGNAQRSILSRVRSTLEEFGIELEAVEVARNSEDGQRERVEIRFPAARLRRLVEPDIELACELLETHRERVNGPERWRDRIRPKSLVGANDEGPPQLWLFGLEEAETAADKLAPAAPETKTPTLLPPLPGELFGSPPEDKTA